jgi:hydrogenase 3 maturation protease
MKINFPNEPSSDWKNEILPADLSALSEKLKKAKRLAIMGVGSELMQDDKAGVDVTLELENKFGSDNPKARFFATYTTPENFTKSIADFKPDHIIIIDAADLKLKPGTFTLLPVERIIDFSLGTHKLSLVMMIKFLKETINPEFSVLAIQYKSIVFGEEMTSEMKEGVKKLTEYLSGNISELH